MTYTVVIGMKTVTTHQNFMEAFGQYIEELVKHAGKHGLTESFARMCWIEGQWPEGNVPAGFMELKMFGIIHGLIVDSMPALNPPPVDEDVVMQFYLELQQGAMGEIGQDVERTVSTLRRL